VDSGSRCSHPILEGGGPSIDPVGPSRCRSPAEARPPRGWRRSGRARFVQSHPQVPGRAAQTSGPQRPATQRPATRGPATRGRAARRPAIQRLPALRLAGSARGGPTCHAKGERQVALRPKAEQHRRGGDPDAGQARTRRADSGITEADSTEARSGCALSSRSCRSAEVGRDGSAERPGLHRVGQSQRVPATADPPATRPAEVAERPAPGSGRHRAPGLCRDQWTSFRSQSEGGQAGSGHKEGRHRSRGLPERRSGWLNQAHDHSPAPHSRRPERTKRSTNGVCEACRSCRHPKRVPRETTVVRPPGPPIPLAQKSPPVDELRSEDSVVRKTGTTDPGTARRSMLFRP
jgi:hypothetical protein